MVFKEVGRKDEAPHCVERLKNCPFIVPVQQDVGSFHCSASFTGIVIFKFFQIALE